MTLEQQITDKARDLGFIAAGIARLGQALSTDKFIRWLADGCAADMQYLHHRLDRRADPTTAWIPGVQSIIVLAAAYPVNPDLGVGFSTFARGLDYHVVLRQKIEALLAWLQTQTTVATARVAVDSAPIFEREWAARAGVGWIGRQGQLVNPDFGCAILLGELLTDVPLQSSPEIPSRCGDCRLCVNACPTGAIREDGLVDARLCLSYLTIEHKGEIPEPLRQHLGQTLFGCDRCTAVCPFNRPGTDHVMSELREKPMPSPADILRMTPEAFTARFQDTTVFRTGLQCLRRNAAIAWSHQSPPNHPASPANKA